MQGAIKQWPKALQPREKLRLEGARSLSDAEPTGDFFTGWRTRQKCR